MGLLERDSALEALTQYAAQARAGDGRVVLISGEAGAGKSALLEQLQRELVGVCWVGGTCDGLFTPRPLGPLFEIAEQLGVNCSRRAAAIRGATSCSLCCYAACRPQVRRSLSRSRICTGQTNQRLTSSGSSAVAFV